MVHSAAWNAIRAERSADTQCPENFVVPNIPHRTNNKENESDYDLKSGALEGLPSLCEPCSQEVAVDTVEYHG